MSTFPCGCRWLSVAVTVVAVIAGELEMVEAGDPPLTDPALISDCWAA
jgi:hypothetical protein